MALERWFGAWRATAAPIGDAGQSDVPAGAAVLDAGAAGDQVDTGDGAVPPLAEAAERADPALDRGALEAAARRVLAGFAAADGARVEASEPNQTRFRAVLDPRGFLSSLTAEAEESPADLDVFRRQRWSLLELPRLLGVETATYRAWSTGLLLPPSEGVGLVEDHHRARTWPTETAPFWGRGSIEAWARRVVAGEAAVPTWRDGLGPRG